MVKILLADQSLPAYPDRVVDVVPASLAPSYRGLLAGSSHPPVAARDPFVMGPMRSMEIQWPPTFDRRLSTKRVILCGSRWWKDWATILHVVMGLPPGTDVIEGGARGADRISRRCASACELRVITVPAQWDVYHRSAGPIRNAEMLKLLPSLVIAFHPNLAESKGTGDMVARALKAAVVTVVVTGREKPEDLQAIGRLLAT